MICSSHAGQPKHNTAMHTLFELVAFEQWLRFMWLQDEQAPCIRVPEAARLALFAERPDLAPLLDALNGLLVSGDGGNTARMAILAHAETHFTANELATLLDNTDFQHRVRCFHNWVQDAEAEQHCESFTAWLHAFALSNALRDTAPTPTPPLLGDEHA